MALLAKQLDFGGRVDSNVDALSFIAAIRVVVAIHVTLVFGVREQATSRAAVVAGDGAERIALVDFGDRVGDVAQLLKELFTNRSHTDQQADGP